MADDPLVLLPPLEGVELEDDVVGQVGVVGSERGGGACFVAGEHVERGARAGVRVERHRRVEDRTRTDGWQPHADVLVGTRFGAGGHQLPGQRRQRHRVRRDDAPRLPHQPCVAGVGDRFPAKGNANPFRRRLIAQRVEIAAEQVHHPDAHRGPLSLAGRTHTFIASRIIGLGTRSFAFRAALATWAAPNALEMTMR